ncbi:MAG: Rrf2 family transcriptional regulator [Eubacterium aggregans]|uniref:Rrf2 family transcriptional regulator n=1 Tax=Eubacterium aggregans TaxID=81409 RepID=UPI002B21E9B0|nr:Rrf2 family transcriptional regulator [Eubacterium aggregans]MEA5073469.1 Rrf2 family transcriptional regulator [Eubacterium aggregans]
MTGEFIVAVHSLVYLKHHDYKVSSEELADNVCTNPARIRKVMGKLCKAKLVVGHAGVVGGYELTDPSGEITLLSIFDAVGSHVIKQPWRSGDVDKDCQISSGIAAIMDKMFEGMDQECRQYLAKITISMVENQLFEATNNQ